MSIRQPVGGSWAKGLSEFSVWKKVRSVFFPFLRRTLFFFSSTIILIKFMNSCFQIILTEYFCIFVLNICMCILAYVQCCCLAPDWGLGLCFWRYSAVEETTPACSIIWGYLQVFNLTSLPWSLYNNDLYYSRKTSVAVLLTLD